MKSPQYERFVLVVLNILALAACLVLGCKLLEKKAERVYWNGQWYDRTEYEKERR